jgi:hypothetical protein
MRCPCECISHISERNLRLYRALPSLSAADSYLHSHGRQLNEVRPRPVARQVMRNAVVWRVSVRSDKVPASCSWGSRLRFRRRDQLVWGLWRLSSVYSTCKQATTTFFHIITNSLLRHFSPTSYKLKSWRSTKEEWIDRHNLQVYEYVSSHYSV